MELESSKVINPTEETQFLSAAKESAAAAAISAASGSNDSAITIDKNGLTSLSLSDKALITLFVTTAIIAASCICVGVTFGVLRTYVENEKVNLEKYYR